jgi:plastocyanin
VTVAVVAVALALAAPRLPPACSGGRFFATTGSLLPGTPVAGPLVVGSTTLALDDVCPPARTKLRTTKRGTTAKATWTSCAGVQGRVRVQITMTSGCLGATGTVVARRARLHRTFAAAPSGCGDGFVDAGRGEQCEQDGACAAGERCTDCACAPLPTTSTSSSTTTTTTSTTTTTTVPGEVNGCIPGMADDHTGQATFTVTFADVPGVNAYEPRCFTVSEGTQVTFEGNFAHHPLVGGAIVDGVEMPDASSPFGLLTDTGTSSTFTLPTAGTYGFYCDQHFEVGMAGAAFVVP